MPQLYLRNKDKEDIKKMFLDGIHFDYEHDDEHGFKASNTVFPEENMDLCIERMRKVCADLNKGYEKS